MLVGVDEGVFTGSNRALYKAIVLTFVPDIWSSWLHHLLRPKGMLRPGLPRS